MDEEEDQYACRMQERQLSLSSFCISPLQSSQVYILVNLFFKVIMLPLLFSGLLSYLVGMKRRTSGCVAGKRDNSHFLHYILISPEAEILCRP